MKTHLKSVGPDLYRMPNGIYYGRKWVHGKLVTKSLKTKDSAVAKAKLKKWLNELAEKKITGCTMKKALEDFLQSKSHQKPRTKMTYKWVMNTMEKSFEGYEKELSNVNANDLKFFFSSLSLKPKSHNLFVEVVQQALDGAVEANQLSKNPLEKLKLRLKVVRKPPQIPTVEQVGKILKTISHQVNASLETSKFAEFLFLAGVGEAEARNIKWKDIDWEKERIHLQRIKTSKHFYVPFYIWLKPYMAKLKEKMSEEPEYKVFRTTSAARSMAAACRKLKYHKFGPRNLRQACIVRLLRSGISPKLIAKFQGHSDGGILIMTRLLRSQSHSTHQDQGSGVQTEGR